MKVKDFVDRYNDNEEFSLDMLADLILKDIDIEDKESLEIELYFAALQFTCATENLYHLLYKIGM